MDSEQPERPIPQRAEPPHNRVPEPPSNRMPEPPRDRVPEPPSNRVSDADRYRVSDRDREQVAELLRRAAGEGRLEIDELEERLETAYAAKTYSELERVTYDLPASADWRPGVPSGQPLSRSVRVGGTPTTSASIAVFSGATRKDSWVVPESYTAVAMFGGVELDLREATLAAPEVAITAVAIMGGVDIVAPDGVHVVVDGVGVMGAFDDHANRGTPPPPDSPVVRIRGVAFMGGVTVKRRPGRSGQ